MLSDDNLCKQLGPRLDQRSGTNCLHADGIHEIFFRKTACKTYPVGKESDELKGEFVAFIKITCTKHSLNIIYCTAVILTKCLMYSSHFAFNKCLLYSCDFVFSKCLLYNSDLAFSKSLL